MREQLGKSGRAADGGAGEDSGIAVRPGSMITRLSGGISFAFADARGGRVRTELTQEQIGSYCDSLAVFLTGEQQEKLARILQGLRTL